MHRLFYRVVTCSFPGARPERFAKALTCGADAVIIDLEDAVAEAEKVSARQSLVHWLQGQAPVYVRINAYGTAWYHGLRVMHRWLMAWPPCSTMMPLRVPSEVARDNS